MASSPIPLVHDALRVACPVCRQLNKPGRERCGGCGHELPFDLQPFFPTEPDAGWAALDPQPPVPYWWYAGIAFTLCAGGIAMLLLDAGAGAGRFVGVATFVAGIWTALAQRRRRRNHHLWRQRRQHYLDTRQPGH